jgi:virulence-associated protein VagC
LVYIEFGGKDMQIAHLFSNGRSQAVRFPKEYQFKGEDLYIHYKKEDVLKELQNKKMMVCQFQQ